MSEPWTTGSILSWARVEQPAAQPMKPATRDITHFCEIVIAGQDSRMAPPGLQPHPLNSSIDMALCLRCPNFPRCSDQFLRTRTPGVGMESRRSAATPFPITALRQLSSFGCYGHLAPGSIVAAVVALDCVARRRDAGDNLSLEAFRNSLGTDRYGR